MSVEFEQEINFNRSFTKQNTFNSGDSKMFAFLIKKGLAKDPKQASIILLLTVVACLTGTFFITFSSSSTERPVTARDKAILEVVTDYKKAGIPSTDFKRRILEDIASGKIK